MKSDDRFDGSIESDDSAARERALDVRRSFLVQAPAGSGKTELLIQRFLALLALVEHPESIVAVTFTRKAAGEMRERIVGALADAIAQKPVDSPHRERTRRLADAALAQDRRHDWQLVAHPARLAVTTIDALAARFARQAPLATGIGASPRYEEYAAPLYAEAARVALAEAPADDVAWRTLLAHVDNDADRVVRLVAEMLGKRDQWISELRPAQRVEFRAMVEATLGAEVTGHFAALVSLVPAAMKRELAALERYAAPNLAADPEKRALAEHLAAAADSGGLPGSEPSYREAWCALANWLLVANDTRFRVQVNVGQGFPARGGGLGAAQRDERKSAMTALLRDLAAVADLAEALHIARCLPERAYDAQAWMLIDALLEVLPRSASYLTLVFREAGVVDFTQGSLAALEALGEEGAPSDLLLKLDSRIDHILVDEFQDTSFTQLALIRRLTAGWQPDDGRTLFAVGDPMQSIYRFRGAEVRLFVDARNEGRIGDVPIENVVLRRNFRSRPQLVAWVNGIFPRVLGSVSDPWRGVVEFVSASAALDAVPDSSTTVDAFVDPAAEAEAVVAHVRAALMSESGNIAVLVRARAHLNSILPAIRAAGIPFAAVELDALAQRQAILDLLSLTHALVQPADRLAWLSVLRAPWCGLTLSDLLAIVREADAQAGASIAALIHSRSNVPGLGSDGRARCSRIADVLAPALDARARASVAVTARAAWLALGGPATLAEAIDLDGAEHYFTLLAKHESGGDVPKWPEFVEALTTSYTAPDRRDPARVQVMTLHRAKGLEFDTVILAGLDRVTPGGEGAILHWRRRPRGLLLAPLTALGTSQTSVYSYLEMLARGEEAAELGRLLYVGCTRAKHRLHLTSVLRTDAAQAPAAWKAPPTGSPLAKLWSAIGDRMNAPSSTASDSPAPNPPRPLARLPLGWNAPTPAAAISVARPGSRVEAMAFDWAHASARHVGTVAHRLFAQIAEEGLDAWSATRLAGLTRRIGAELVSAGVDDSEVSAAVQSVVTAVERLLADERGRWLFDAAHSEPQSEWAVAGVRDEGVERIIIDRTFVADGTRWIVDLKTSSHEGADREGFLDREVERYRDELERYAHFVRLLDARPIRLALYYPLLGGWREWAAGGQDEIG